MPNEPNYHANKAGSLRVRLFVLFLFAVLAAFIWIAVSVEFRHCLANRPDWVSSKPQLEMGVIFSKTYNVSPVSLFGHRLNLSGWFTYQEVYFKDKIDPNLISFDYFIEDESYLAILFGFVEGRVIGLRISRAEDFSGMKFTAGPDLCFEEKEPFGPALLTTGSGRAHIVLDSEYVHLKLNGKEVGRFRRPPGKQFKFGFRGGTLKQAYIDNIEIIDAATGKVYEDSFGVLDQLWVPFIWVVLGMAAAVTFLGMSIFGRAVKEDEQTKAYHRVLAVLWVFLFAGLIFYPVLRWHLAGRHNFTLFYFNTYVRLLTLDNNIESREMVLDRLKKDYGRKAPEGVKRVLFIGSSQTWGSGARQRDLTWLNRLETMLNSSSDRRYEVINTGISGAESPRLYKYYLEKWISFRPSVTIINLGFNDQNGPVLYENLIKIIRLNKEKGIKTVLSLEPTEVSTPRPSVFEMHKLTRKAAKEEGVILADFHGYLAKRKDDGFIWWDPVHLADCGQKLAAEFYYQQDFWP